MIIINDGSTDQTFSQLVNEFKFVKQSQKSTRFTQYQSMIHNNLILIDKPNSGKAHSLNLALEFVDSPYFLSVDADTFISENSILLAVNKMLENKKCLAVGGAVRILNGSNTKSLTQIRGGLPQNPITMFQIVEYIRSFFGGRIGWEKAGGTALISGAFCLYRTEEFKDSGGFDPQSVTEDFESTINLLEHHFNRNHKIELHMISEPVCWTIAPESLVDLFKQRLRWQKGLVQTLYKHKHLIFNPRIGRTGLLTLPHMLIFEAISPFVELGTYFILFFSWWSQRLQTEYLLTWLSAGISFYILLTLACIRLEEKTFSKSNPKKSRLKFIAYAILENFGYRQFLLIARLAGTLASYKKSYTWAHHDRRKLEEQDAA